MKGRLLGASATVVHDAILAMIRRWSTAHVPLTYLTDEYCNALSASRTDNGFFGKPMEAAARLPIPRTREADMDESSWRAAWIRLLGLMEANHAPEFFRAWRHHYRRISGAPTFHTDFKAFLWYDIRIRERSVQEWCDPAMWHKEVWDRVAVDIQDAKIEAAVEQRLTNMVHADAQRRFRSPPLTDHGHPSKRSRDDRSFPYPRTTHDSRKPTTLRCIFCGVHGHSAQECRAESFPNGARTFLTKFDGYWRLPNGDRVCFGYNGRGCANRSGHCNKGRHLCSLCGDSNHAAQTCRITHPTRNNHAEGRTVAESSGRR